ncbi:MAG: NAD(P)H-dependent oxidoreductase subunit E, partial [Deltaproteobacteria bacterium]
MDLRQLEARPTDDERNAIDAVLGHGEGHPVTPLRAASELRHLLLPALHAAQGRVGWVSPGALGYVAERLHVPPAEAYGVASFFALFALERRPPSVAHVCDDLACRAAGAESLCASLTRTLGPAGTTRDGVMWQRTPCLGLCEQAPAVLTVRAGREPAEQSFGGATEALVLRALAGAVPEGDARPVIPQAGDPSLVLLRRVGVADPDRLDDYRAHGGYESLRRAFEMGPVGVLREVSESGLLGRGGAAFPTGRKWEAVSKAVARPHYVVCNADESEPGTFKDRVLLELDPFA